MIFFFDRVENIVGKGENAGYQYFLLFPQCFQNMFYSGLLGLCGKELTIRFRQSKVVLLFVENCF